MKKIILLFVLAFVLAGTFSCKSQSILRENVADKITKNKTNEIVVIRKDITRQFDLTYIIDRKNELCFAYLGGRNMVQISCQHFSDEVIAAESLSVEKTK